MKRRKNDDGLVKWSNADFGLRSAFVTEIVKMTARYESVHECCLDVKQSGDLIHYEKDTLAHIISYSQLLRSTLVVGVRQII